MTQAIDFAEAVHDMHLTLGAQRVLDEEKIVEARGKREEHPVLTHQRNEVIDVIVLACRVIEEGIVAAFKLEVVVFDQVDGKLFVDIPRQFVVDQTRIDAYDGGVVERRNLYFPVFGIHAAKINNCSKNLNPR